MKKKIGPVIYILAVLAAGGGAMALLSSFKAEPAMVAQETRARTVNTAPLEPGNQTMWVTGEGFLDSPRILALHSPLPGRISFALDGLKGGTPVRKGDVLFSLDDRRARLAYEGARNELIQGVSSFITMAGFDGEEREAWNAYLAKLRTASSRRLPPMPRGDVRWEQLAVTKGVIPAAHRLEGAAMDLNDHVLTAPFDGVLSGEGITPGAYVSPGLALGELRETNPLELTLSLGAEYLDIITIGTSVEIIRPALGDGIPERAEGRVIRKEAFVQPASQRARIYVSVPFDEGRAWPAGTFVQARLKGREWEEAYRLPREALIDGRVPLLREGKLAWGEIALLGKDGDDIIFRADLPRGSRYVTTLLQAPLEGMALAEEAVQ